MQAASNRSRRYVYLHFKNEGHIFLLYNIFHYYSYYVYNTKSGTTPLVLLALLLFQSPSELTLKKLLVLLVLAERSHQLLAADYMYNI